MEANTNVITESPELNIIIIITRNPNISDAIWKPFIKKRDYIHKQHTFLDIFNFVNNEYPNWHSFCWKNLEIKKD